MGNINLFFVVLVAIFISYTNGQTCSYGILGIYTECKDCVTAIVCSNEKNIRSRKCDEKNPYCYRGICGNVLDPYANQLTCPALNTYECTSSGVFPDPLDCTRYYSCKVSGSVVTTISCPSGFVFSDVTGGCKKQENPKECAVVDCKSTMDNGIFSPYSLSRIYYALCIVKPGTLADPPVFDQPNAIRIAEDKFEECAAPQYDILVFRCAKGAQFDGNPNISTCVFKCPSEGYFAYSLDKRMYYDCKTIGGNGVLRICDNGLEFDEDYGLCLSAMLRQK